MAAETGSGGEESLVLLSAEAEGLGGGGFEDLPDVDAHGGVDDLQFVDQGDVDGAVDVLGEFAGFGDLATGDGDDPLDAGAVESGRQVAAGGVETRRRPSGWCGW
jgi:hypothetical protein